MNIRKVLEKVQNWKNAAKTLQLEISRTDNVFEKWLSIIEEFNESLDILQELANPSLKVNYNCFVVLTIVI